MSGQQELIERFPDRLMIQALERIQRAVEENGGIADWAESVEEVVDHYILGDLARIVFAVLAVLDSIPLADQDTCPTCGGSQRVPYGVDDLPYTKPCPDCTKKQGGVMGGDKLTKSQRMFGNETPLQKAERERDRYKAQRDQLLAAVAEMGAELEGRAIEKSAYVGPESLHDLRRREAVYLAYRDGAQLVRDLADRISSEGGRA